MKLHLLAIFVLCLPAVLSLGIASPHFTNDFLELEPGESKIISLSVQKTENEEINIEFNLDSEIAELMGDNIIFMEKDQNEVIVKLNISIPRTVLVGQEYTVNYNIRPIIDNTESTFLNLVVDDGFKVKVIKLELTKTEKEETNYLPILALVLLIIVFRLLYKRSSIITNRLMKK